jgi:hypothetical protein
MAEDETKLLENCPILQRLLESQKRVEAHMKTLEENVERQSFNTKPMWDRAMTEFAEVKQLLATLSCKIDVFSGDMLNLRAEKLQNERRLSRLDTNNAGGRW